MKRNGRGLADCQGVGMKKTSSILASLAAAVLALAGCANEQHPDAPAETTPSAATEQQTAETEPAADETTETPTDEGGHGEHFPEPTEPAELAEPGRELNSDEQSYIDTMAGQVPYLNPDEALALGDEFCVHAYATQPANETEFVEQTIQFASDQGLDEYEAGAIAGGAVLLLCRENLAPVEDVLTPPID